MDPSMEEFIDEVREIELPEDEEIQQLEAGLRKKDKKATERLIECTVAWKRWMYILLKRKVQAINPSIKILILQKHSTLCYHSVTRFLIA